LKATLLATAAAGLLMASTSADAAIILDGWNINLSVSGVAGATDMTNIDHVGIRGFSTVTQQVSGGSALGQSFSEHRYLVFENYFKEGAPFSTNVNAGGAGANHVIFRFDNLTGTLNPGGNVTFNPGSGTIRLFIDTTNSPTFDAGDVELATFKIINPSGGS